MSLSKIVVVLDRPQDASNIGGVVRAMKNMGLHRLRLVRPCAFDLQRIEVVAHRSGDLVERIQFYDSLASALADVTFVAATSARLRDEILPLRSPGEAAPDLLLEAERGQAAVVFGREDQGLPRSALALCHLLLKIPTAADYASLNLAQAVLLVAYELRLAWERIQAEQDGRPTIQQHAEPPAPLSAIDETLAAVETALWRIRFLKPGQDKAILGVVRHLVQRASPTQRELALLKAMAVEVVKYLDRHGV